MIHVHVDLRDRFSRRCVKEVLDLYSELNEEAITYTKEPPVGLYIVDYANHRYDRRKTLLIGFKIPKHHCLKNLDNCQMTLRVVSRLIQRPLYNPEFVQVGRRESSVVDVSEICTIETCKRHLLIRTQTRDYKDRRPIHHWIHLLRKSPFIEIYRGVVVNLAAVERLETDFLVLKNGIKLPVARRRYTKVQKRLGLIQEINLHKK